MKTASYALVRSKDLRIDTCAEFWEREVNADFWKSALKGWRQDTHWWFEND